MAGPCEDLKPSEALDISWSLSQYGEPPKFFVLTYPEMSAVETFWHTMKISKMIEDRENDEAIGEFNSILFFFFGDFNAHS